MVKVPSGARCLGCQYALEWLEAPRCPECGRGFDPADSATFWLPGDRTARVGGVIIGLIRWASKEPLNATRRATAGWLMCAAGMLSVWQVSIPLGVLGTATAIGIAAATLGDLLKSPKARRPKGLALPIVMAIVVTMALNVSFERCPHATYVSFGPVSVAISGRACNNRRDRTAILNVLTGIRNPWPAL